MVRSVVAVVVGWVTIGILVSFTDRILGRLFPETFTMVNNVVPESGALLIQLGYVTAYATVGGMVTSAIAGHSFYRNAAGLAALNLLLVMVTYNFVSPALSVAPPAWYYAALSVIGVVGAFLGAFVWKSWKGDRAPLEDWPEAYAEDEAEADEASEGDEA